MTSIFSDFRKWRPRLCVLLLLITATILYIYKSNDFPFGGQSHTQFITEKLSSQSVSAEKSASAPNTQSSDKPKEELPPIYQDPANKLPMAADFPLLTVEDRIDKEGLPAQRVKRGPNERRVFENPMIRVPKRNNLEPVKPFGVASTARKSSAHANQGKFLKSAVEVGISHRIFRMAAQGGSHRMEVPLTEKSNVVLDLEEIVDRGDNTFSFVGKVEGHADSYAILVYNEGTLTGGVTLYGKKLSDTKDYQFVAMEEGLVAIQDVDPQSQDSFNCETCDNPDHCTEERDHPDYKAILEAAGITNVWLDPLLFNPADITNIVDITVGYSVRARVADGGVAAIEGRILSGVDRFNQCLKNSGIDNTRLVLLGLMEDSSFDEHLHTEYENDYLTNEFDGVLDELHEFDSFLGSDLVCIVKEWGGSSAGVNSWYSNVERSSISNTGLTFCHEVGHNFGNAHAIMDSTSSRYTKDKDFYGWRFHYNGTYRRTVMSYSGTWGGWTRVMYFSSPDVRYPGFPDHIRTGVPRGYNANISNGLQNRGDLAPDGISDISAVGAGYDGSNPQLGANNVRTLKTYAPENARFVTRESLNAVSPQSVQANVPYLIKWSGGVAKDCVRVELLRGTEVISLIESSLPNTSHSLSWTPTVDLVSSSTYSFRVTLIDTQHVDYATTTSSAFRIVGQANALTWDLSTTVGLQGGSGIWSAINSNWTENGVDLAPWTQGSIAYLEGDLETITDITLLGQLKSNNIIRSGTGTYRLLSSSDNSLSINGVIEVPAGSGLILDGIGSGNFTGYFDKTGAGFLEIRGTDASHNYEGGITLSDGSIRIRENSGLEAEEFILNGGTIGSADSAPQFLNGKITIGGNIVLGAADGLGNGDVSLGSVGLSGAIRSLTANSVVNLNGVVSNGGINKLGGGVMTLTNPNNSYASGTTIVAGEIQVFSKTDQTGLLATLGTGQVNIKPGGILRFSTESSNEPKIYGNQISLESANLISGDGLYSLTGSLVLTGANTIHISPDKSLTLAGPISGGGSITTSGSTLVLTGNNSYNGGTKILSGTLQIGGTTGTLAPQAVTIGNLTDSGKFILGDTENLKNISISNLTSSGIGTSNTIVGGNAANSTLTVNTTTFGNLIGTLGGYGTNENNLNLIKSGSGVLTLDGVGTLTGKVTVSGGRLGVRNGTELGDPASIEEDKLTLNGGALMNMTNASSTTSYSSGWSPTLSANFGITLGESGGEIRVGFGNTKTFTINGPIRGGGGLTKSDSGNLILAGDNTYAGDTAITGGMLQIGNGGATGTLGNGSVANATTLTINRSGNYTVANAISGKGLLSHLGIGTTTLTGNNTFNGRTLIQGGGTLVVSTVTDSGGVGSLGTLTTAGDTWLRVQENSTLRITGTGNQITSRRIWNNAALTGSGTFDVVDAGAKIAFTDAAGSIERTLVKAGIGSLSFAQPITGTGGITVNAGVLTMLGVNTTSGPIILNGGTLELGSSSNQTLSGLVSGPGSLVKSGAGTLMLTNSNTYTGDTTVASGTLSVSKAFLADACAVHIASNAKLALPHGGSDMVSKLFLNNIQQPAGTYTSGNSQFITGNGKLIVSDSPPVASAYELWIASFFPSNTDPLILSPDSDPDGDNVANRIEFIINGNPNNFSQKGMLWVGIQEDYLVMSLAIRGVNTLFSGSPSPSAEIDSVNFAIEGSINLNEFNAPVSNTNFILPANWLPVPPTGYQYHSFKLVDSSGLSTKGFLRLKATQL